MQYGHRDRKFCSRQCSAMYQSKKAKKNITIQICLYCKNSFYSNNWGGIIKKYCSKECHYKHITPINAQCNYCKKDFHAPPSTIKRSKSGKIYCSYKCYNKDRKPKHKKCPYCEDSFLPKRPQQIHCSQKCMLNSHRRKLKCIICNKIIIVPKKKKEYIKFCSIDCYRVWQKKYPISKDSTKLKDQINHLNKEYHELIKQEALVEIKLSDVLSTIGVNTKYIKSNKNEVIKLIKEMENYYDRQRKTIRGTKTGN